uniref:DNA polymerase n=1 Tax=viral metagenome TaxID=1070528 RepID=A0A6M3JVZ2_9ZZZZ
MKVEELLKGIKYVMPGVDQAQIVSEGADLITFEGQWVRSYDGRLSVSYPLETGLACSVLGKPLYDLLTKLGGGNVRMILEGDQFQLKGAGKKLTLQVVQRDLDQDVFDLSKASFVPLPKDFTEGVGLCFFSVAKDPTLGPLTGMYIEGKMILASDNFRISHYEMEGEIQGPVILPYECVTYITKMEGISEVAVDAPSWIHFRNEDGITLSSRLVSGEYRKDGILKILGVEKEGNYVFPDGLADAVTRAKVVGYEDSYDNPIVLLQREGKQLVVVGQKKGVGEYEERVAWEADFPEDGRMEMNPDFLMKVLKITKSFSVDKAGKFAIFTGKNFEHLEITKVI